MLNTEKYKQVIMPLQAKDLAVLPQRDTAIKEHIQEILRRIDDKIEQSYNASKNVAYIELPSTFGDVPNISNKNAQIIIYGRIIQDLEKRGFNVSLRKDSPLLTVTWHIKIDKTHIEEMTQIIKNHIH